MEATLMKCLIVEDDPISSQVMAKMISRHGSFEVVDNGREAVEMFQRAHESNCPYDLIMMDLMIPEINGLQAALIIREKEALMDISVTQRVKIIVATALDDPRTVIKALYDSDANSFLVKPITVQKIEAELRSLKLIV
jgi:two-component system chemotaxis response regulator CheY